MRADNHVLPIKHSLYVGLLGVKRTYEWWGSFDNVN